jgi:hypothetical protein
MATVNFLMLQARAGTEEGARVRFAQLVVDVVKVLHGNVRDIRANPGDWGTTLSSARPTRASR